MTRRVAVRTAVAAVGAAVLGPVGGAAAPPARPKWEGVPQAGHLRSGPLGLTPASVTRSPGVRPIALRMAKFGIDAPVEYLQIVEGIMQDPSGPWVVGWYEPTAALGQFGNAVFSGHVDYYTVGPAVFWYITNGDVQDGDEILAVGDDGAEFRYGVTHRETLEVTALTPEKIGEIVGPTKHESLTIVTCGGVFDQSRGEYLSRTWVRAVRLFN
jgi:Sortase domain